MAMKPSLVFLHGGPGFQDYLEPHFRQLSDSFDCTFYHQQRGSDLTIDDLVAELSLKVAQSMPILVGHSWGGVLATEFAARHEDKISGLVLMSTGICNKQWHKYRSDLNELGLADAPMHQIVLVDKDPITSGAFLEDMGATFSEKTFDSLHEKYLKQFDLTEALRGFSLRVLSISGEKDLRFSPKIAKQIERLNPLIKTHFIADAGHFPFLQEKNREEIHHILRDAFANP